MINAAAGPFDGVGYEGAGTAVFNPDPFASQLDVTGLSIPDGATYSFTLDLTFVEQQIGTLHLFGLPSIDGTTQVPAPASLVLVGVAMLGLAVARRRIGRV